MSSAGRLVVQEGDVASMISPLENERWLETADAASRQEHPDGYWCILDENGVQYFWHEQTVTRDEYLGHSDKDDCAATRAGSPPA